MRLFLAITSLIALPFLSLHTSFSQEITATDGSISFVCKSSQVLSFGTNRNGRFGNGLESTEYGSGAAQVSQKLTKLVSNGSGIGAVTEAGDVIVWGDLDWQQIGIRGFETPVLTPLTLPYIDNVDHLAFGLGHTVFLRNDSTVSVCGSNRHSQHAMPSDFVLDSGHTTVPISQVMKVAAGTASVFALKSDGELFGWGANWGNCLSVASSSLIVETPELVHRELHPLKDLVIGRDASRGNSIYVITEDDRLFAWGNNEKKQLGIEEDLVTEPIEIVIDGKTCKKVAASQNHTTLLMTDGTVYCAGLNLFGQLGQGNIDPILGFIQVGSLENVVDLIAGVNNTLAIKEDGTIWGWGRNVGSALVPPLSESVISVPVKIHAPCELTDIASEIETTLVGSPYPTPSQDFVAIDVNDSFFIESVVVRDARGLRMDVSSQLQDHRLIVDLTRQSPGMYFVTIRSKAGHVVREKIVKQ